MLCQRKMNQFTYEPEMTVRFRDIDAYDQVHNAVFLIYVEEARVRYFRDVLGEEFTELNGAIVHQDIEYSSSITLEDRVTVPYRVARLGETSLTMEFEVRTTGDDGDSLAAEGSVTQVVLNEDDEPRPIPDAWREAVCGFEDAPIDGVM